MGAKTRTRKDIEAEVTSKVLDALEAGTVPWRKPWRSAGLLPTSATTAKPYRGINTWLLSLAAFEAGFESPYWLTYRQTRGFGGHVRKGEHGTLVVFWKRIEVMNPEAEDGKKTIPLLRSYVVFNLDQCDEVTMPPRFTPEEFEPLEPGEAVESVLSG